MKVHTRHVLSWMAMICSIVLTLFAIGPVSPAAAATGAEFLYNASPQADPLAPAAPSGLEVAPAGPHQIRLTWVDNSNNETGFMITNGTDNRTVPANRTTFIWKGLAPGTYMCFRISAFNPLASSDWFPSTPPYYVCTSTPSPGRP